MPDTIKELDVTKIAPHHKHAAIFDTYDALEIGESFIIINDHDPKPLHYQMAATKGKKKFSWDYLQKGPKIWKVHIGKKSR